MNNNLHNQIEEQKNQIFTEFIIKKDNVFLLIGIKTQIP